MNKLLLILLSAAMSIQTPLPAAKPNDKKNKTKKNKKTKKIKKNASRKTSSGIISPIITPIKKEEPKKNITLAEISKNTIEKIDNLIQTTRKDAREYTLIEKAKKKIKEDTLTNKNKIQDPIIDILGEQQTTYIEMIKNKIEKNETINLSEKTKNQESIETIFPINEAEKATTPMKTTFNTKLIEIINDYNAQIKNQKIEIKNANLQKNIGTAKENLDLQENLPLSHYDNNTTENTSINAELNRLSKEIKNGQDLKIYLFTCIEKYLDIKKELLMNEITAEDTIKKELNNSSHLEKKISSLITYLREKISLAEKKKRETAIKKDNIKKDGEKQAAMTSESDSSIANEFTFIINNIINALVEHGTDGIKPVLKAINIINKINKNLTQIDIFVNQRIAEKQAADKEERKKKSVVEKSSQQLEIALKKLNILINKIDKNNMNNAEIKTFIELNLEIIGGEFTKFPIIARNKHIKSKRDKQILINNINELKKTIDNAKIAFYSEYQKTLNTILYSIEKYNIDAPKEQQKIDHANIYKVIDNIKAKKWSDFAPSKAKKNKEESETEAPGNDIIEESNIYSKTPEESNISKK